MNQVGNLKKSQANPALLPRAKAHELTRIYGKSGECRVKLTELAIGGVNRCISWKYVHSLIHRILMEEGFSEERYKHAIAVEPKADDPLASSRRHREEAAAAAGMLPMVPEARLCGLLTKNHLFLALLSLLVGHIKKRFRSDSDLDAPAGRRDR